MAKKSIKSCPLELKEWVNYLFSLIKYRFNSTHVAQQSDFTKIVIILTGLNISFLWLYFITEYNFYPGVFKPLAFIASALVVLYLIYKFAVIHLQTKNALIKGRKTTQTWSLIDDIINGKYKEDEVDKVRDEYIKIWKLKK